MSFSSELLNWYSNNKRDLPWRKTSDPYKIWLSEIILQQTRVNQGMPYYYNFITEFPTIFDLANASEDKVLKIWQGLGYYSRARNLHFTAKYICSHFNGKFPEKYNQILSLKGVGTYTAAAISSFAFNKHYAVLDGNVIRVLARFIGVDIFYDTVHGKKQFQDLANTYLPKEKSDIYNQAIMEFGALVCKPKNPDCNNCVFTDNCFAKNQSMIYELPKKANKIKIKNRYLCFLIIKNSESILFLKKKSGVWSGLYEFPSIEFLENISNNRILQSDELLCFFKNQKFQVNHISSTIIHKLSHQKIHVKFLHINCDTINNLDYLKIDLSEIHKLPVSRLIDKYLSKNSI